MQRQVAIYILLQLCCEGVVKNSDFSKKPNNTHMKSKASRCSRAFNGHRHTWTSLFFCSSSTSPGCLSNERVNSEHWKSEALQFLCTSSNALFCPMTTVSVVGKCLFHCNPATPAWVNQFLIVKYSDYLRIIF